MMSQAQDEVGKNHRGALIVIEGLDRAGKSTQHNRICDHLEARGHKIERLRFPDRSTATGQAISSVLSGTSSLDDRALHLLFSANRWEARSQIIDAITHGTTVVIDRYYYSGIVYSVAKDIPGLSVSWAKAPEIGLPRPDLILFLDISPEAAATRDGYGEEKYETVKMQEKVRSLFMTVLREEESGRPCTRIVDASQSIDEVTNTIRRLVDALLGNGSKMSRPLEMIA